MMVSSLRTSAKAQKKDIGRLQELEKIDGQVGPFCDFSRLQSRPYWVSGKALSILLPCFFIAVPDENSGKRNRSRSADRIAPDVEAEIFWLLSAP